jgi:glycolate oxidase FAD binding subunit
VSVSTRSIGEALAAIAGADGVAEGPGVTLDGVRPRWLVRPASMDALAAAVAVAHDAALAVCPVGSGSSLELGTPIEHVDVAIDLRRLDAVLDYNPDDLTVSVQAGVTLDALNRLLLARRQFLPVDPPGGRTRTLGGIAATHAHGPWRVRYRSLRDLVLGLRFVQADGVVTWGGARVVKSVTGYDIPKLMVGALGTLGVLTELTLRLQPLPDLERTWIVSVPGSDAATEFVARLLDSTVQPSRVELLDAAAARAAVPDMTTAALAVSLASVEEAVRAQGATIASMAEACRGKTAEVGTGFWDGYDRATAPASRPLWLKLTTLPSQLAAVLRAAEAEGRAAGADLSVTGCAALGLLRVGVSTLAVEAAGRLIEALRARLIDHGGSVVIERGPRALRARVDPWGPIDPGALALMRALKETFDPTGTLNRGRFVGKI